MTVQSSIVGPQNIPVFLLAVSGFAVSANLRLMDTLLPEISSEFSVSLADAAQIVTAFTVGYGISQLTMGVLADRVGKLRIIIVLCMLSVVTTFACAWAASFSQLTWARLLAGASTSGIVPIAMAWIGDVVPIDRRATTLAHHMSGGIAGAVLGQMVGGISAEYMGWRFAPMLLASMFLVVGLALWIQAGRGSRQAVRSGQSGSARLRMGAVLEEIRHNRKAWVTLIAISIEGIAVFGTLAYVSADLHLRLGMSLAMAGLMLGCFALGGMTFLLVAPRLFRLLGQAQLLLLAGAAYCLGMVSLALAPTGATVPISMGLAGFGFYLLHNNLQTASTQISSSARGTGVALFATIFFFAQAIGVLVAAALIESIGFPLLFGGAGGIVLLLSGWLSMQSRMG